MIKSATLMISSIIFVALLFGCEQSANEAVEMYRQAQVLEKNGHVLLVGEDDTGARIVLKNERSGLVKQKLIIGFKNANAIHCFNTTCWVGGGRSLDGSLVEVDSSLSSEKNQILSVEGGEVYALSYIPNKDLVVLGHATGKISFVPRNRVSDTWTVNVSEVEIFAVAYSDLLGKVVCGDERGKLYFIAPDVNYDVVNTIPGNGAVYSISAFDSKNFLIGRSTGEVQLLNVETLESKTLLTAGNNAVTVCDVDKKLGKVACGMSDGGVYGVIIENGNSIKLYSHDSKVIGIKLYGKEGFGVSVDSSGNIKKWKI